MSRYTKAMHIADFYSRMEKLGFTYSETETLRRAQLTLHRWSERECNGEVERDETTGKTYYFSNSRGERTSHRVPDLETGAWKRVLATVEARNSRTWILSGETGEYNVKRGNTATDLVAYHQTDPRGASLYLVKKSDLGEHDISAVYNRGFGVCID